LQNAILLGFELRVIQLEFREINWFSIDARNHLIFRWAISTGACEKEKECA
jgi:hypothetical protein